MGKAEVVMIKNERVVRVTDLTKSYREHTAVRGLNLEINRGEIYGIIGPDG